VPDVLARFEPERAQFEEAFPESADDSEGAVSVANIAKAIASYERSLISADSRYDRYVYGGNADALSDVEKRGLQLFNSERAECYHCHGGVFFTSAVAFAGTTATESGYENNGLYDADATDVAPVHLGLFNISGQPRDRGRFKVPTLRNIEVTAPYMHDGSLATLEDVVAHYVQGGAQSERQSALVRPLDLTTDEQAALIAFLRTLTDDAFLGR
jgi:cytochrome c peroxidase